MTFLIKSLTRQLIVAQEVLMYMYMCTFKSLALSLRIALSLQYFSAEVQDKIITMALLEKGRWWNLDVIYTVHVPHSWKSV